jgi:CheY-like chemotaxis protein
MDGLAVTAAHNGESGVREALSGAFEIVILDVMLPVLDGRKVLRRIRLHSQIPVIMLRQRWKNNWTALIAPAAFAQRCSILLKTISSDAAFRQMRAAFTMLLLISGLFLFRAVR